MLITSLFYLIFTKSIVYILFLRDNNITLTQIKGISIDEEINHNNTCVSNGHLIYMPTTSTSTLHSKST